MISIAGILLIRIAFPFSILGRDARDPLRVAAELYPVVVVCCGEA